MIVWGPASAVDLTGCLLPRVRVNQQLHFLGMSAGLFVGPAMSYISFGVLSRRSLIAEGWRCHLQMPQDLSCMAGSQAPAPMITH